MGVAEVAVLAAVAFCLGRAPRGRRVELALAASVICIFWMQPAAAARYSAFWLPAAALGVTTFAWALTAPREALRRIENQTAAGIIFGLILALAGTRYLNADEFILAAPPPRIEIVLLFIGLCAAGVFFLTRIQTRFLLWLFLFFLIALLLVLKTPPLTLTFARIWRFFAAQPTTLAAPADLQWLGFSYLAFRIIHTIRDRQAGRLPETTLGEYVTYAFFFPALAAGPIDRIERFIQDLRQPAAPLSENLTLGGKRLLVGMFKKFVVADTLAMLALNPINSTQVADARGAWLLLYAYAFRIFFDFSGYTDIALGLARFMGIALPENFNRPYAQPNLTLFWNNWHATLTNWFRAYFFNPLTRALRSQRKISAGAIIFAAQTLTMILIGLWHGVAWNFAAWGLWHGLGLFAQNRWSGWIQPRLAASNLSLRAQQALSVLGILITFHYVALGWIWFVLPDLEQGWRFSLLLWGLQ